jgi:signal transduction histidine kinase
MTLDLRTVFLMDAALYLMLHGAIWFGLARYRNTWVTLWSASGILSAMGLFFLGTRGFAPEWMAVLLGQFLMAAGNWGRQYSLRSLVGQPSSRWLWGQGLFNLAYLSLGGALFFCGASDWLLMVIFYAFYTVNCLDYFLIGRTIKQRTQLSGATAVMAAGMVLSGTLGIKLLALLGGWGAPGLYDMAWDQLVMFLGQFVAISLLCVGFMQIFVDQIHAVSLKLEHDLALEQAHALALEKSRAQLGDLLQEREEIIRQLTLSNKTAGMGALVASIAHELNQPLTSILLKAELVESHLSHPAEPSSLTPSNAQLLDMLRQDTLHAGAIIRRLRSMFANGKAEFSPLDLAALVNDVVQIVRSQAQRLDISLQIDVSGPLPIHGDVTQLQQVILNLLNNAMESFEGVQGRAFSISITGARRGDWVELRIADNGCGIAKDLQSDVFALFKTSKDKGMGVGLWLSRSVVEGHAGRLELASEPSSGAVFSLALPVLK